MLRAQEESIPFIIMENGHYSFVSDLPFSGFLGLVILNFHVVLEGWYILAKMRNEKSPIVSELVLHLKYKLRVETNLG